MFRCRLFLIAFFLFGPAAGVAATVVTYGTSLTAAYPWGEALREAAGGCGAQITVVNGAEVARASDWGLDHLEDRVLAHRPDVVVMEFAINDAYVPYHISLGQSRRNTETLIARIRVRFPRARIILMTMNPVWKGFEADRPALDRYYGQYHAIAKVAGVELIDNLADWKRMAPDRFHRLVADGVHPSLDGHRLVTVPNLAARLCREMRVKGFPHP